jgi:phosphopantothenoylcysteine decarboxylase/phosphopantothenate--cysteine ligase
MKILIGVTGSIACYKSFDLVRNLVKSGHEVKVVLSKGALEFIKPELFQWLGAKNVYGPMDDFKQQTPQQQDGGILHIELARWAEKICLSPLSANSLAKMANGFCDDLLTSIVLSRKQDIPLILAPAMNPEMFQNNLTQANLSKLMSQPATFLIPPEEGLVACGENGTGKLASIEAIQTLIECLSTTQPSGKTIVITTGATIAPLDPVRYLTNPASGLTGLLLAQAFLSRGHRVFVVAGNNCDPRIKHLKNHPQATVIQAQTADQMHSAVSHLQTQTDIFIASAAVSDFKFNYTTSKVKKDTFKGSLPISSGVDILKEFIAKKTSNQFIVGFAAENPLSESVLNQKLSTKPVDLLIGTQVNGNFQSGENSPTGFAATHANYLVWDNGMFHRFDGISKLELANFITQKAEAWSNSSKHATLS